MWNKVPRTWRLIASLIGLQLGGKVHPAAWCSVRGADLWVSAGPPGSYSGSGQESAWKPSSGCRMWLLVLVGARFPYAASCQPAFPAAWSPPDPHLLTGSFSCFESLAPPSASSRRTEENSGVKGSRDYKSPLCSRRLIPCREGSPAEKREGSWSREGGGGCGGWEAGQVQVLIGLLLFGVEGRAGDGLSILQLVLPFPF